MDSESETVKNNETPEKPVKPTRIPGRGPEIFDAKDAEKFMGIDPEIQRQFYDSEESAAN